MRFFEHYFVEKQIIAGNEERLHSYYPKFINYYWLYENEDISFVLEKRKGWAVFLGGSLTLLVAFLFELHLYFNFIQPFEISPVFFVSLFGFIIISLTVLS